MSDISSGILEEFRTRGYQGRIVSIGRVRELRDAIERGREEGLLDREFFRVWLEGFAFEPPRDLKDAKSIIVAAVPHPRFRVTFHEGAESRSFIIPPTYLHYTDKVLTDMLSEVLDRGGLRLARAFLPVKLLLARSGLGKYGRNNISYIEGMGSYYRLSAFYSDIPCADDTWQDMAMLDECSECTACVRACPTGAISTDRFLLRAERCIPFFNERDVEFPEWMDPSWHNSLIGCMVCQNVCPVDKPFRDCVEDKAAFSEEETNLILEGVPFDSHSSETQGKLREIEWTEDLDILARNLRMLLARGCTNGGRKKPEK